MIRKVYLDLIRTGWALWMIDEMDFLYYLRLVDFKLGNPAGEVRATIDKFF